MENLVNVARLRIKFRFHSKTIIPSPFHHEIIEECKSEKKWIIYKSNKPFLVISLAEPTEPKKILLPSAHFFLVFTINPPFRFKCIMMHYPSPDR